MTTTTTDVAPRRSPARQVAAAGGLAAVVSAVLAVGLGAIALAVDVPMEVVLAGGTSPEQIPLAAFGVASIVAVGAATLLAVALQRWVRRAALVFTVTAVVVTVLSIIPVLGAEGASDATKVVLALAHVVVAAVAVPVLATSLAKADTQ